MDNLEAHEREEAWKSAWHPSFDGWAIVNEDFTFRSANPKFWELLGITPAEVIGQRFQDVTPPELRKLDEDNAKMVIQGQIPFYLLPKTYQFAGKPPIDVVLLVTRIPRDGAKPFQYFLSRIMLDEKGELQTMKNELSGSEQSYPKSIGSVVDFLMKYGKWIAGIGVLIGSIIITLQEVIK